MKVFINPESKNWIFTVCIGDDYSSDFMKYSLPGWMRYCERYNIGLAVFFDELIDKSSRFYKKSNWQRFLCPSIIREIFPHVESVCYLDTDVLVSPAAPNIFDSHVEGKISVISEVANLPYSLDLAKRSMAFYRNKYYSEEYPLDSALFQTPQDIFNYHGFNLMGVDDYFCSGVFVLDVRTHASKFNDWFFEYEKNIDSITGGGEEPFFNFHVQKDDHINIIDYRYQAIWTYEMAIKFPFLYELKDQKSSLVARCIKTSLHTNFFLHFAGSWYEGQMWKSECLCFTPEEVKMMENFNSYIKTTVTGKPAGLIRPNNIQTKNN